MIYQLFYGIFDEKYNRNELNYVKIKMEIETITIETIPIELDRIKLNYNKIELK